eukprot:gb/GFBE01058014.1/.p1 GENE.gb/GFBE01058014.1/~~gb/GFBE01058014.1/.p1  ORF type:complete len:488 (+),score=142.31 gb/GFBE01058014.1/:1-1464(+)
MAVEDPEDFEEEEVQEHLKDAVDGSLRLKRMLSDDSKSAQQGSTKKRKTAHGEVGAAEAAAIEALLAKWDCLDDVVLRHVLEGVELWEVEEIGKSGWVPDKNSQWMSDPNTGRVRPQSIADLCNKRLVATRHSKTSGGGALDPIATFRFKWKLEPATETQLRALCHKDLDYVIKNYDGTKELSEVIAEAAEKEAEWNLSIPDAPGVAALGRMLRLEIIEATADAAVFGDANLTFSLNLAKHRKALGHVGRVIATTFEPLNTLRERYKEIDETISTLWNHYAEVFHEVDCTRIAVNPQFKGLEGSLGAVYYNFPHAGSVAGFFDGHPMVNWRHENLMRLFFRALRFFVKPGGLVKVASNMGAVGVRFSFITGGAQENEFTHLETVPFLQWSLRRYGRAYGDRRDATRRPDQGQGYNVQKAERDMVYTFKYTPSGKVLPPQGVRLPPTLAILEECIDGPFDSLVGQAKKDMAKKLHDRFLTEISGTHVG